MPNHKLKYEDIKKFVEIESESGCKLISTKYNGCKEKLEFQCKCGQKFETLWSHFKSGVKRQCNDCGYKKRPRKYFMKYEDVKNEIENNSKCKLITTKYDYEKEVVKNRKSPTMINLTLLCGDCNIEIFHTSLRRFRERKKDCCYNCSIKRRSWSYKQVKNYIEKESNSGCRLISKEYRGVLEPLEIKCYCGNIFYTSFHQFKDLRKQQCNKHTLSIGEKIIYEYLLNKNIQFKTQYTFDDCRNVKPLPFDFAIFKDNKLIILIEFHGLQHYEPKGFGEKNENKVKEKFINQQKNDKIKLEYCKKNKIDLLIIPYWERKNIEKILDTHLSKYIES
jgi:hypothetical protein